MAVTDPASRVERLVRRNAVHMNEEFLRTLRLVKDDINLADLAELLERGRFDEAFQVVRRAGSRLSVLYAESFVSAGNGAASFLTNNVPDVVIDFDMTNQRAVNAMRSNQLRLVSAFTEQQRVATQQALVEGITQGLNPRQQAVMFRNSIGLTPMQERWVRNYEAALRELDPRALARELRDRRFDRTVLAAIENEQPLTDRQVARMVDRYRERALKLRSQTIARTEALRSVHEGTQELYDQAIESGELLPDQLVRIWNTAADERVRDFPKAQTSHRTMHNQERRVNEPFVSGAGNQAFNPGSFGVGEEDINCRCTVSTRILAVDEVPSIAGITIVGAGL